MFVYRCQKVKRLNRKIVDIRVISIRMAKKEPTTAELRQVQQEKTTGEHEAIDQSATPDEADQHARRASKAAYLARKLAERERSERES
jgi:hypothetical protein